MLEPDRLALQLLIQAIQIAEIPFRVVEPMILVRAGVDRFQIGLKLRQPGGRGHQVVDQEPALGIRQQRLVDGRPERRLVVGEQLGRGDPVQPCRI